MPTPSVAFNLTCAFNPGSAKLLFNVREHGVFGVTREKCISNMQSKSDPVLLLFFFIRRVKEQSNTTAKRSETNMLFWHICHLRGLRRTPPAGSDIVCVFARLQKCNGVINCVSVFTHVCCVYCQCFIHAYHRHMVLHRQNMPVDMLYMYACPSMCEFMSGVRCYCAWSDSGWQVFAGFSGPVRFPCRPEALVESEPGLHRAWLKDAPLISPVRESVNSLRITSWGAANQLPSVIT